MICNPADGLFNILKICVLTLCFLAAGLGPAARAEGVLQIALPGDGAPNPSNPYYYYSHLLMLALDKTRATDGDYNIVYNNHGGGFIRDMAMVMAGAGLMLFGYRPPKSGNSSCELLI